MARKISYINYKGGVGKTSCLVNTAACLAQMGHRVLVCDFDAQSNASIWMMRLDRWNALNTSPIGSVFSTFVNPQSTVEKCIVKDAIRDKSGTPMLPGLDVLPTTFNLIDIEHEYRSDPQNPHYAIFQEQLAAVEDNYDFIFFDCPPNVLRAAQCALFTCNEIYVPSNPDALSLVGFTLLVDKLMQFHDRSASFRKSGMGRAALIYGIIFNSIKTNVDIEVPKMRMQFRMNQFKKQRKVGQEAKIFEVSVRDAIVVRRAVTLGLPVCLVGLKKGTDTVYDDYIGIANQIVGMGNVI